MKKKIIALSIAFVLIVGAAIGTTLAYLTDKAGVINNFTLGDISFEAKEYVNHTNAAGSIDRETEGDIEDGEDPYNGFKEIDLFDPTNELEHHYMGILPGDKLAKDIVVSETNNSAYFAVTVRVKNGTKFPTAFYDVNTDDDDATNDWDPDWNATANAALNIDYSSTNPATGVTLLAVDKSNDETDDQFDFTNAQVETNEVVYIFYYYVPKASGFTLDLGTICPTNVDTDSGFNDFEINVQVAAIQADNTVSASNAIAELNSAIPPVAAPVVNG
ncbi:MAG: hypothetical protein IJB76_04420 [Clostridia bacterium]|nr:hypothetical protein [Clostridia bacterium]